MQTTQLLLLGKTGCFKEYFLLDFQMEQGCCASVMAFIAQTRYVVFNTEVNPAEFGRKVTYLDDLTNAKHHRCHLGGYPLDDLHIPDPFFPGLGEGLPL